MKFYMMSAENFEYIDTLLGTCLWIAFCFKQRSIWNILIEIIRLFNKRQNWETLQLQNNKGNFRTLESIFKKIITALICHSKTVEFCWSFSITVIIFVAFSKYVSLNNFFNPIIPSFSMETYMKRYYGIFYIPK